MIGLQLSVYTEETRHLPVGICPPGLIVEEVRKRNNVDYLGDVLVDSLLKSFRLLEEWPWLPSDGTERWGLLKKLLIGPTTGERNLFLESLGLRELSFAMLTTVRDNKCSVTRRTCSIAQPFGFLTPVGHPQLTQPTLHDHFYFCFGNRPRERGSMG